jgi:hypothetical protein
MGQLNHKVIEEEEDEKSEVIEPAESSSSE